MWLYLQQSRIKWSHCVAQDQCDQTARLFVQYLAIFNNEFYLISNSIKELLKLVQNIDKHQINHYKIVQVYESGAKFCQIWSHCVAQDTRATLKREKAPDFE